MPPFHSVTRPAASSSSACSIPLLRLRLAGTISMPLILRINLRKLGRRLSSLTLIVISVISTPFFCITPYCCCYYITITFYFKERSVYVFCRGYLSAWVLRSFFGLSAVSSYSIGRIILSIKAISSSVRPYFLYSISSVHGWEKSWRGTSPNTLRVTCMVPFP